MSISYDQVHNTLTSKNYYRRDRRFYIYDYEEVAGHYFRKCPGEPGEKRKIAFLGAAQVFGCHIADPFPSRTVRRLGTSGYNLGVAGAGPEYFLHHPEVIDIINSCEIAVVQIMSGRSVSFPGLTVSPNRNAQHRDPVSGKTRKNEVYFSDRIAEGPDKLEEALLKMRSAYVEWYRKLIGEIKVPVIPIWTAAREPGVLPTHTDKIKEALGSFPQFVDSTLVRDIETLSSEAVLAIAPLEPKQAPLRWRENRCSTWGTEKTLSVGYYLSDAFHERAAQLLEERIRATL